MYGPRERCVVCGRPTEALPCRYCGGTGGDPQAPHVRCPVCGGSKRVWACPVDYMIPEKDRAEGVTCRPSRKAPLMLMSPSWKDSPPPRPAADGPTFCRDCLYRIYDHCNFLLDGAACAAVVDDWGWDYVNGHRKIVHIPCSDVNDGACRCFLRATLWKRFLGLFRIPKPVVMRDRSAETKR